MPETTPLTPCTCGHVAFMHHFSRYLGFIGEDGRGKCGATNCECTSYKADERKAS